MRSPPPVPPLREDLRVKKVGARVVVEDPVRRVRVPIDALTLAVLEVLSEGPCDPDDLAEAIEAPRVELQRRVALLCRQNLLETPRAVDQLRVHEAAAASSSMDIEGSEGPRGGGAAAVALAELPLRFHATLSHGCVACGGCCHGTDVGPLKDDDVARVRAVDWREVLPDVEPDAWIDDVPAERSPTGTAIRLMGMREGRCVFLGPDKLCIIHKHKGAAHKPTICRQFPFTFTRTPAGLDVSFSTECRAWWKARNNAPPPEHDAEQRAAIAQLLREGAPVLSLPVPIALADGVDIDVATWEALRAQMLDGLAAASDTRALVRAVVRPVHAALDALSEGYRDSELFATRGAFSVPEPDAVDQTARFFQTVERVKRGLGEGIGALVVQMRQAGQRDEADRAARLAWGIDELLAGRRIDDLVPFGHALDVWRDLAAASVQAHEPARHGAGGRDVVLGVATLALKLTVGPLLAALSAQAALRGRVHEQEVVDAMVLVTKLPRGSAFERLFAGMRRDLAALFVCDVMTLVAGEAPRPLPAWL